jgi:hypothetical protein
MSLEKPEYTKEQLEKIANIAISTSVKFSQALAEALKYLPEHARHLVAEAMKGGE